ncbi:hypothetical protein [Lysobacter sp. CA199]|uniref:hypothetical protein n=1 Tax=Lysobacter sp. CA199 TaxID=3455608 RepID=UPI003F8D3C6F
MTTKIGTATNYADLLTKLDAFLTATGHAWGLTFTGAGNGRLRGPGGTVGGYIGTASSVTETIHVVASSATTFNVTGTTTGALGTATVGVDFTSAVVEFRIVAGTTAFQAGDEFALNTGPKWKRLRLGGCLETTYRTASMTNVAQLFDGITDTAIPASALPGTVRVEMMVPTEVRAVAIWCGAVNTSPKDFALEWSDDGSAWTVAQAWSGQTWPAQYSRRDFLVTVAPGAHRYWRINITAAQTASLTMTEVRLFADTGMKWDVSSRVEFAWEAPGYDGAQKIYAAGFTDTNVPTDYFNLVFRGYRYWLDPQMSVLDVPNHSGNKALLLSKTPIAYWITVNGARVIIAVRVSSFYQFAYIGFGLPYETPDAHQFPYLVGAPYPGLGARWDISNIARYRNPCDPGSVGSSTGDNCCLAAIFPNGEMIQVGNRSDSSSSADGTGYSNSTARTWPYSLEVNGQMMPREWGDNYEGSKASLPVVIYKHTAPIHQWGEFDGVVWITGHRNSAETIEQMGAIDFIAIPNVNRSGFEHYCAIALD